MAVRHAALALVLAMAACSGPEPNTGVPGLRVGDVLGAGPQDVQFARAESPRSFEFPADHGPHPEFRSEWWYLTLALEDGHGREFGVQFTVFRQALFPGGPVDDPWRNGQAYLAHFAVTDVEGARHREAERLSRGHPALAGARATAPSSAMHTGNPDGMVLRDDFETHGTPAGLVDVDETGFGGPHWREGGFEVWLEDWRLTGAGNDWLLEADAGDFAASIRLAPGKPVVLQGDRGLSAKGPGQASYYYSVPRLAAVGRLQVEDITYPVTGLGWLDREWSTSVLGPHQVGWDWFALMLENGDDLMAFRLRRDDGARDPHDHGVLVDASGRSRHLDSGDFHLEPLDWWRDEQGVQWPIRWALTVGERRWLVSAALPDQRMDTLLTYWEGLVHVLDRNGVRTGRGYMELTGYGTTPLHP